MWIITNIAYSNFTRSYDWALTNFVSWIFVVNSNTNAHIVFFSIFFLFFLFLGKRSTFIEEQQNCEWLQTKRTNQGGQSQNNNKANEKKNWKRKLRKLSTSEGKVIHPVKVCRPGQLEVEWPKPQHTTPVSCMVRVSRSPCPPERRRMKLLAF